MTDNINKPDHYTQGKVECIDAIESALTPEEFAGFLKGNIIKYVWREKKKGGVESILKSRWYLQRLLHGRSAFKTDGVTMSGINSSNIAKANNDFDAIRYATMMVNEKQKNHDLFAKDIFNNGFHQSPSGETPTSPADTVRRQGDVGQTKVKKKCLSSKPKSAKRTSSLTLKNVSKILRARSIGSSVTAINREFPITFSSTKAKRTGSRSRSQVSKQRRRKPRSVERS